MNNFEKIKAMDKAAMIDFLMGFREVCDGCCDLCPLINVPQYCTPTNVLRWLESEANSNG
jgi:hypothetical protein